MAGTLLRTRIGPIPSEFSTIFICVPGSLSPSACRCRAARTRQAASQLHALAQTVFCQGPLPSFSSSMPTPPGRLHPCLAHSRYKMCEPPSSALPQCVLCTSTKDSCSCGLALELVVYTSASPETSHSSRIPLSPAFSVGAKESLIEQMIECIS